MHLMYFTEQPMSAYDAQAGLDFGATALMFSNRHFDPVAGSRLYNEYLEHYRLAEEVGFDGIMLNEHHNAPFCMQAKCNVFASILAAMTRRVKLVLLGNPLPLADNPVRLAEELAMIDMVSRWRPATPAAPSIAVTCSAATSPRPKRRRWPTPSSSCGCRASSRGWRIPCGRARRAISRPRTARPSSNTRSGGAPTRAAPPSRTRSRTSRSWRARRRR